MNDIVKTRSDLSIVMVFFSLMAIGGLVGAAFLVNDFARARASVAWPVTEAIILTSVDGNDLRYVYSVRGHSFEGSRSQFFTAGYSHSEKTAGPGEIVNVYVDPQDPNFAVLYPGGIGAFFSVLLLLFGGFLFFGVGGVVRILSLSVPPMQENYSETAF